jgi:hypothetical protein
MDIMAFIRKYVLPFGIIGLLTAGVSHEYTQGNQIENNKVMIQEEYKRIDRLESKIDKLLEKSDNQNDKIDDLRIELLKQE